MTYEPFFHLRTERAPLYRAVLHVFTQARAHFRSYLRPADVAASLREQGHSVDQVDDVLAQLATWGNLSAHPDTAEVATIEEFYRARFLYQLTRKGEAVEHAVASYVAALERAGELQAAALDDVRRFLLELLRLADIDPIDSTAVFEVLTALAERFGGLVEQARTFMGGIQRAVDLRGSEAERLLAYKDKLIQYLERFIGQLVSVSAEVAELLGGLTEIRLGRIVAAAARRELADRLDTGPEAEQLAIAGWRGRLEGIATWFLSRPGVPSQAEELRRRAREAIPALLGAISAHHDRRMTRSDRVSDLRTLAKWFAEAPEDEQAHRLWRAAFTQSPARHLSIDEATQSAWEAARASAATPWAVAPAMEVSPRMRATGKHAKPGRPEPIVDRSAERAFLAQRREEEALQLAEAEEVLVTGRPFRLSELPPLSNATFDLLLDLLGDAGRAGESPSADGRFVVYIEPASAGALATVSCGRGRLSGPDYRLSVRRAGMTSSAERLAG